MTETEYVQATNLAKISTAINILHDTMTGDEYGVDPIEMASIRSKLSFMQEGLFADVEIKS